MSNTVSFRRFTTVFRMFRISIPSNVRKRLQARTTVSSNDVQTPQLPTGGGGDADSTPTRKGKEISFRINNSAIVRSFALKRSSSRFKITSSVL